MTLDQLSVHAFIQKYGIKTERGERLDFRQHLFLFDLLSDWHPRQVWYKAPQVGGSTIQIIKTLWAAAHKKWDVIYTLPTAADVNDFVSGKVNRIIAANPILAEYVKDKDSVEQKRVLDNVVYYRGTWTEKSALMVSSDLNVHDEEDASKSEVIDQYLSRLQHSKFKGEWHFSNPSVQGAGISRYWPLSDQREWMHKCSRCNERQVLTWPESIDIDAKVIICKKCKQEFRSEDRRIGNWIPKEPGKDYHGYHISHLMCPWISADQIVRYFHEKSIEYFTNFVLGLPYAGDDTRLTPNTLFQNCTYKINDQQRTIIGVDVGKTIHVVAGNSQGLFYAAKFQGFEDVARLLNRLEGSTAVIDAGPDIFGPRELRERFPGRVFLCSFARDKKRLQLVRWGKHEEDGHVLADRNRMIQLVVDEFSQRRIPLQGKADDWGEYWSHWSTLYKETTTDALGHPFPEWKSTTGLDHFALATTYWRIGMDRFGGGAGSIIGSDTPSIETVRGTEILPGNKELARTYVFPERENVYDEA